MHRTAPTLACLAIAALILAPAASASHWSLHEHVGMHPSETLEDDGAVLHAPGNPLHGKTNKVVPEGRSPGDGSLFLDALMGSTARTRTTQLVEIDLYAGLAAGSLVDRPNLLLPGSHRVFAWYGQWLDGNGDGVIEDRHDALGDAGDEFRWRGHASGEGDVAMAVAIIPSTTVGGFHGGGGSTDSTRHNSVVMEDRTAPDREEQVWMSSSTAAIESLDASLFSNLYTFALAGAQRSTSSPNVLGRDASDPNALWDVDRYEALNGDVALLWSGVLTAVLDRTPNEIVQDTRHTIDQILLGQGVDTRALQATVTAIATSPLEAVTIAHATLSPAYSKEPNHADDRFPGATFGGVGDVVGSHNTYEGYQSYWGFHFDMIHVLSPCFRADALAATPCPTVPLTAFDERHVDPLATVVGGNRSSGAILTFYADPLVWWDKNLDTHVGEVCDPGDPEAFDAERNTCRPEHEDYPHPYPRRPSDEAAGVCEFSGAKGGTIVLTPEGAAWQNVVVIRDAKELGRTDAASTFEVRADAAPIVLRWDDSCSGTFNDSLYARDYVLFPTGAALVPFRASTTVHLANFLTPDGIHLGYQEVRDVDFIQPLL